MQERKYGMKDFIKYMGIFFIRAIVRFFYVIPVKADRVVVSSYLGTQYAGNPKVISEYIQERGKGKYEIIWAFKKKNDFAFLKDSGIKLVGYYSVKRLYLEAIAKYCIDNAAGCHAWFPLRKGQYHIDTWHGGGCYKTDGILEKRGKFALKRLLFHIHETTHMISSSTFFSQETLRKALLYKGEILESGMPRNDILFAEEGHAGIRQKLAAAYHLDMQKIWVLYAPTWREKGNICNPDVERVKEAVATRFGAESIFLKRTHKFMEPHAGQSMTDVTDYADMQDLLCACDILITDYSSSLWDFSFTFKPCFIYAPDVEIYNRNRGFYKDIHTWGFPVCENDEALFRAIVCFEEQVHKKNMDRHHQELGSFEKGNAAESFYRYFFMK